MTTDTPRTDAAIWRLTTFSSALLEHDGETCNEIYCVSQDEAECLVDLLNKKELELAISLENQVKAQAEIKEIRNALGDDGRRTHKEILEMAFKASGWREWKKKYIDLNNAHIAEGQDPAGTIWEHADKLQKELKETKAEVAKLNHQLLKTESDLLQSQDISFFLSGEFDIANARAKKAEAEVDRLTGLLRSLRKLPSSDWYREHNIPLQ